MAYLMSECGATEKPLRKDSDVSNRTEPKTVELPGMVAIAVVRPLKVSR